VYARCSLVHAGKPSSRDAPLPAQYWVSWRLCCTRSSSRHLSPGPMHDLPSPSTTRAHVSYKQTLDPVDGTKGFLRNDQYAVALGLIDHGEVVLGVLGCPWLPDRWEVRQACDCGCVCVCACACVCVRAHVCVCVCVCVCSATARSSRCRTRPARVARSSLLSGAVAATCSAWTTRVRRPSLCVHI
jgi:hypothetical protein